MIDLPDTIKHPATFKRSPAAGCDGVFDWSWTQGCFGNTKISPMDWDGVVERRGNFLVFETKDIGVPIPDGQMYTLESAYRLNCFTLFFIQGKTLPEMALAWCQPGFSSGTKMNEYAEIDADRAHHFVSSWFEYATANPRKDIDVSFLNRRITTAENKLDAVKLKVTEMVCALGGTVNW